MIGPKKTLEAYRNGYAGKRAFILGNGPSLNRLDLSKLAGEVTFGTNGIFYLFDRMGFQPTFYVVEDKLFAEDRVEEVNSLRGTTKIFGDYLAYCFDDSADVIWANVHFDFREYPGFPHFSRDAAEHLWVGGTVSYLCMQLAYFMGFSEVYLIGFDHSYTIPSDAIVNGNEITSRSADPNHFHPEYFGAGKRWHLPRTERMELAYGRARDAFRADGRAIYNATAGGRLEVFPRASYDRLFDAPRQRTAPPPAPTPERNDDIRISVVVCTYRNPDLLEKALLSLTNQTLDARSFEVIVVDNNSNDSTPDVVARFPSMRYVFEAEQGLSAARNAGIRAARSDIIAYIDDDAEASPAWLAALLDVYDRHPEVVAAGGAAVPIWDAPPPSWLTEDHHRALSLVSWGDQPRPLEWPERIIGVNCSFRRSVFEQYGSFDTQLGRTGASLLGAEEVALQKRIQDSGAVVYYTPSAVVHHHVPPSRLTRLYFQRRRIGSKLDQAVLEMRARGIGDRIPQVIDPIRSAAAAGAGAGAQGDAAIECLKRAFAVLRSTPGWPEFEAAVMGTAEERQELKSRASEAVMFGDWRAAEKHLRAFAHRMLISPEAYVPLIELVLMQGDFERAAEEIALARVLDHQHRGLRHLRGIVFHHLHDLEGARDTFRKILAENPQDIDTSLALAKVELDMELFEQAYQIYRSATETDPSRIEAWLGLARVCLKLEARAGFENAVEQARELDAAHPELTRMLNGEPVEFGPEFGARTDGAEMKQPRPSSFTSHSEKRKVDVRTELSEWASVKPRVRISAVVCTYRNPNLLEKALESLLAQTLERRDYEVIVVDNNSQDRTNVVVSAYPSVRYVLERRQGLANARNAGVLAAQGEVIAFIDDDAEAAPGWLAALLEVYQSVPSALAVGGRAIPIWDASPPEWLDENYHRPLSLIDWGAEIRPLRWPERIIGVNCSFRRQVFARIGSFDVALGRMGQCLLGSEDTEIQQRIHDAGHGVYYTPRAVVRHHVPAWRMTRPYLLERQLGNLVSLAISVLRECEAERGIERIRSILRDGAHPDLIIPDLSKNVAALGAAFRHAVILLQATAHWPAFEADQLVTPEEMNRLLCATREALSEGNWGAAEGNLRALVNRAPLHPIAYLPLIDFLTLVERLDEALEIIEFGLAVNPGDPPLLRHLGDNRRRRGDFTGALEPLQHSLERASKEPATVVALGRLALDAGRPQEALAYYRRAADLAPTDVECWIDLARGARELGERRLCADAIQRARAIDPGRHELEELEREPAAAPARMAALVRSNTYLERCRDIHRGERCVIIGNGPSLNRMDLSFLKNETTFGLNRIYLLSERLEFEPDYYVCMNPLVLEQSAPDIQAIRALKFLSAQCMHLFANTEETVFLQPMPTPDFATDPSCGVWEGYTVTYVALQLAYFMGFSEVVLIGVDHEYTHAPGMPNQEVVATGDDPNHFHPGYFGEGIRWHLPDLDNAEVAYRLAHEHFQQGGRSIIDATVEGKLNVFPKRDYREIFEIPQDRQTSADRSKPAPALVSARPTCGYKVSAIVSTYGADRLLRGCIEDLQRQTIADRTEIIVIDSGSPQDEDGIVREFQNGNPNIVYIRTQRETLYEAWNRGIAMARGEYITNANTDDRHRPDALELLSRELDRREVGLVYADSLITTRENETFERHTADRIWKLPPFSVRQVLMDCPFGPQPMWRRAVHDEIGVFDGNYRLAGDYEFFMRLAIQHDAYHIDDVLGLYCEAPDNLSYNQEAMEAELAQFLGRVRSTIPIEQIYPFLQEDVSEEAQLAAWFDYANQLVWMTPNPALEYAEEIYRKLIARSGERSELVHNLALVLLLQGRPDEGAAMLGDLRQRSEIAANNLRLLEAGSDVNPRDLRIARIAHPGLQHLIDVIPAWNTRVPMGK